MDKHTRLGLILLWLSIGLYFYVTPCAAVMIWGN